MPKLPKYFCKKIKKHFCPHFQICLCKFWNIFVQILKYICSNSTQTQKQVMRACCVIFFVQIAKTYLSKVIFLKIARISRCEFDADVRKREERRQISSQSLQALLSGCGLTTVVSSRLRLARVWKQWFKNILHFDILQLFLHFAFGQVSSQLLQALRSKCATSSSVVEYQCTRPQELQTTRVVLQTTIPETTKALQCDQMGSVFVSDRLWKPCS